MKPQRTILHTIETGGPGGAETVLLNLASGMDASRFRSLALLPCEGWLSASLQERGVPVHIVSGAGKLGPVPKMIQLVRRQAVDLIHSHLPDQNFYACIAGRSTGRPVIATYHGDLQLSGPGGKRRKLKLGLVRRSATAVVAVSDYLRRALLEVGFPAARTVRIYNGIETSRFRQAARGRLRAELGCHNGAKLVGMVANLRQSKNYECFVQAAGRVAQVEPRARFVAVGELDAELEERVTRLLRQLSLEDRFHLLGFRQDVPELLADLDCFVLSSESEGFSIATVEAMAAGAPVVVTRSGGPQEIVEHERTGLLVAPGDPEGLARGIASQLLDPARAAVMAANARAEVEKRFSIHNMVQQYGELYESLLKS